MKMRETNIAYLLARKQPFVDPDEKHAQLQEIKAQ
jgi:hypothetical protein|tara:strand:+ start:54 stop:158 length:105 start_codon:yes stop_codon:yes gene_type:complete